MKAKQQSNAFYLYMYILVHATIRDLTGVLPSFLGLSVTSVAVGTGW